METEEASSSASKKTTMAGLPLTNPTPKAVSHQATSAATGKKDPYADMGTMTLSADKRGKEKSARHISSRSFLLESKNGTIVSSDEAKEVKGHKESPYSEMGVTIDFPERKSKSRSKEEIDVDIMSSAKERGSEVSERRMIRRKNDPYSDLGSSSNSVGGKGNGVKKNMKTESEAGTAKADVGQITETLNKLIEKAKEISSKTSEGQKGPMQGKLTGVEKGNAKISVKDPYSDVGSLVKKNMTSLTGTKKSLESIVESPNDEEFQNDSDVKSKVKQLSGNSVTGVTKLSKESKHEMNPQGYRRKDPYSDVGSAIDVKE